jgi:hypothetical protein
MGHNEKSKTVALEDILPYENKECKDGRGRSHLRSKQVDYKDIEDPSFLKTKGRWKIHRERECLDLLFEHEKIERLDPTKSNRAHKKHEEGEAQCPRVENSAKCISDDL